MLDAFMVLSPVRDDGDEIIDLCYAYVNDAACRLNGLTREQMLGRRIGELFPAYLDGELFQAQRRVVEMGEPSRKEDIVYEGDWHARRSAVRAFDSSMVAFGDGRRQLARRDRARADRAADA